MKRAAVPISVLIPTRNEARNIEECLRSVAFAADVVVVDSRSTDGTAEMAARLGARVIDFDWNGRYPKKKNWALENVPFHHEWLLIVDADERVTAALADEIARHLHAGGPEGFFVNRRFFFMNGWINHCGYYPSWNLRLFRHALGRYERPEGGEVGTAGDNEVHEHVVLKGRTEYLRHHLLHYAYPTIETWVEKHNRYSSWEARVGEHEMPGRAADELHGTPFGNELQRKRWLKRLAPRTIARPTLRFLYHYVWRRGFLDGYRGFVLCRLMAWYEFLSVVKARERAMGHRPEEGAWRTEG
jgi:glycosyltransferase involved in cell wall biosynthesis